MAGFPDFVIRFGSEDKEFFCVVSDTKVLYGKTYEEYEKKVLRYIDRRGIEIYRIKRIDN